MVLAVYVREVLPATVMSVVPPEFNPTQLTIPPLYKIFLAEGGFYKVSIYQILMTFLQWLGKTIGL